jgi:hypothetical protein
LIFNKLIWSDKNSFLCRYLHQILGADDVGADQRVGRLDAPEAQAVGFGQRVQML